MFMNMIEQNLIQKLWNVCSWDILQLKKDINIILQKSIGTSLL